MTEKLHLEPVDNVPAFLDGEIYELQWMPSVATGPPDISGLPSIDHALYLFNTVKFHLGQNYRFFDEGEFVNQLHEFYYGNPLEKATQCRLWFVQFLLVLAFGNAFLSRSRNTKDPPGSKFFVRAMSLMPDLPSLWKDSLLAIEVLALAGLYLYSVDHRESAHVYVRINLHLFISSLTIWLRSVRRYASPNWEVCIPSFLRGNLALGL